MSTEIPGLRHHKLLNGGAPAGWRGVLPKAWTGPEILDKTPPALFAVVSTWFDADIIGATVRNCFAQGCREVLVLDNASPDDTVSVAVAAGAKVVKVYHTDYYDDDYRIQLQNEIVREHVEKWKLSDAWWMTLDADEFPTGPGGTRVLDALSALPQEIRTVGSNAIDLYPTKDTLYNVGQHPAACMTMGVWRRGGINRYCECGHWKHLLLRYRSGVFDVASARGNHNPYVPPDSPLIYEPPFDVTLFHAPLRREKDARRRLEALCGKGKRSAGDDQVTGSNGATKRWQSLDAVYSARWDQVDLPHTQMYGRPVRGIALYPWRVLAPQLDHLFPDHQQKENQNRCGLSLPVLATPISSP